ncbi:fatty acid desaturase [Candidatus Nomurabacteria bacterium]|nr:fatty acid desaturase [Candidatus Nomurabacteria bacterium]USN94984.1 MAG: fatty acid desaturase [Candidatus Nomurabacteria bacterium]
MEILVFCLLFAAHHYASLSMQTLFLHRYSAHGQFSMERRTEKVFFALTWIFQGSSYLSAHAYGIMHRMHHEYADTELDPHSPRFVRYGPIGLMARTWKFYNGISSGKIKIEKRFLERYLPKWYKFDRFASHWATRVSWIGIYALLYYAILGSWWTMWFMWPLFIITIFMGPTHGLIINYFNHKVGSKKFSMKNDSTNIPISSVMLGENYHNNHHKHPWSPDFSLGEGSDPGYSLMLILDYYKVIRLRPDIDTNHASSY